MVCMDNLLQFVLQNLRERTKPLRLIAKESGVPFKTLAKVSDGTTKNPRIETVQPLADYFSIGSTSKSGDRRKQGAA